MRFLKKIFITTLKKTELASALAVRLMKLTGKSEYPIHPKHFLYERPWFTEYLTPKDVLLDVGCGNGQNTLKAAKSVNKVVAIELNDDLIQIAKSAVKLKRFNNIFFEKSDLEKELPFESNTFSKTLFLDVLEHLNSRDQILKEIKRVLKPNALMFLGIPNSSTSWKKTQRAVGICSFSDPDHKIEFTEKSIKKLLAKHKFKIIKFSYGKYDIPIRGLVDILGVFSMTIYRKIHNWRAKKSLLEPQNASGFEIVCKNVK